jgi:putative tricarboxylic transport membrane protein
MDLDLAFFTGLFVDTFFNYWWVILPAIFLGIIVGAIPGFSAANTIIILLPLTLAMGEEMGLMFMVALYCSSRLGAGIPAILVNIPGTAGAAATPLDGYPLTQKGMGPQALSISFVSSNIGGLLTTIVVLFTMQYIIELVYVLHSVEMIVIMLFGISLIATIAAKDTLKGLIAGFFGLMIGYIGADVIYETPRGTFGFLELYDKVPLIPALVGLFAISEAFLIIERKSILSKAGQEKMINSTWGDTFEGAGIAFKRWWHIVWTSQIGLIIGVIPGAGAAIASFVAYQQSKTFSKTPELYGTGHYEGLIAPESANNGVTSGTLVPLLVIGIPGGATAAIMLVVLQYHGTTVGPDLFVEKPELAYGVFTAMLLTYMMMLPAGFPLARYMSRVTMVPTRYVTPIIIAFTLVGSFVPRGYVFDMNVALVFGIIGYIARKTDYHVAAILIGVILGPMLENFFIIALRMSKGDVMTLFSSTTGNVLWVCLVLSLVLPYLKEWRKSRKAERDAIHEGEAAEQGGTTE